MLIDPEGQPETWTKDMQPSLAHVFSPCRPLPLLMLKTLDLLSGEGAARETSCHFAHTLNFAVDALAMDAVTPEDMQLTLLVNIDLLNSSIIQSLLNRALRMFPSLCLKDAPKCL